MTAQSDAILVEAVRHGYRPAFDRLYRRHVGAVATAVRGRLRDREQVADLVQETFARALESLSRLENAERFRPWLLAIARHTALDALHNAIRARIELLETIDDTATDEPGPLDLAELTELLALVRGAVAGLSRRDATAIWLVALGFEVADVADALGIEHGAAKVALHRARQRLKARLLLDVLTHRWAAGCPELKRLPTTDLLVIARHLDACATCASTARSALY